MHDRLLIAGEKEGKAQIKVYTRKGTFTGTTIPSRCFQSEAERIILYECVSTEGPLSRPTSPNEKTPSTPSTAPTCRMSGRSVTITWQHRRRQTVDMPPFQGVRKCLTFGVLTSGTARVPSAGALAAR